MCVVRVTGTPFLPYILSIRAGNTWASTGRYRASAQRPHLAHFTLTIAQPRVRVTCCCAEHRAGARCQGHVVARARAGLATALGPTEVFILKYSRCHEVTCELARLCYLHHEQCLDRWLLFKTDDGKTQ